MKKSCQLRYCCISKPYEKQEACVNTIVCNLLYTVLIIKHIEIVFVNPLGLMGIFLHEILIDAQLWLVQLEEAKTNSNVIIVMGKDKKGQQNLIIA